MNETSAENEFLKVTSPNQRRELGQFFTPRTVSLPMVEWASYDFETSSFLDPGVGTGIFTREFIQSRRQRNLRSNVLIDCVDVDPNVLAFAKSEIDAQPGENVNFFLEDFVRFAPKKLYRTIVSNPPYYKHHFIENKTEAVDTIFAHTGYRLPVTTNIYCLFLFRARALMETPGRCAFIIPSEFLNADYGVQVKQHLARDEAFRGLIAFNFKTLVFDKALTTACIVLFDTNHQSSDEVKFVSLTDPRMLGPAFNLFEGKSRADHTPSAQLLESTFTFNRVDLDPQRKWKNYLVKNGSQVNLTRRFVPLATYASCSRGIATGANDYFTFSESRLLENDISKSDVLQCVTKSADVQSRIFDEKDFDKLVEQGARTYLLNPKPPASAAVNRYLQEGISDGIDKRYLPAHRDNWYQPERQRPADIWVMVFSRGRTRFIWNKAGVNHLTTFHGIYPFILGEAYLKPLLLYLWSDSCQEIMEEQQRQYGNGLKKYEPRDIERILVPNFESGDPNWLTEAEDLVSEIDERHRASSDDSDIQDKIETFLGRTWLRSTVSLVRSQGSD